jgi:hypothetical protein
MNEKLHLALTAGVFVAITVYVIVSMILHPV